MVSKEKNVQLRANLSGRAFIILLVESTSSRRVGGEEWSSFWGKRKSLRGSESMKLSGEEKEERGDDRGTRIKSN